MAGHKKTKGEGFSRGTTAGSRMSIAAEGTRESIGNGAIACNYDGLRPPATVPTPCAQTGMSVLLRLWPLATDHWLNSSP